MLWARGGTLWTWNGTFGARAVRCGRGRYVVGAGQCAGCDLSDSAWARLVLKLVSLRRLGRGFGFT